MGFSQYIDLLPGSGYGGTGIGAPIFVGRNRSIALTLDVTDAPSDAAASVYLETAASQFSKRWRKLGTTVDVAGPGQTSISATGADAFVRARYAVAEPNTVGMGLAGRASLPLVAAAAVTGTGVTTAVDMAQYHGGRFAALVTAAPGGGQTLALTVERSGDGEGWATAATFSAISAAGEYTVESADLDRFVRVRRVPSGVGSWTFGVGGTAHLIYARVRDRSMLGVRGAAVPDVDDTTKALATAIRASADVATLLNRYDHPLIAWPGDIVGHTIAFWDWYLVAGEGADANDPGAILYRQVRDDAERALRLIGGAERGIAGRKAAPVGIVDSAPANELGEVKRWGFESTPNPYGTGDGYAGI
jgi:hypothetical protein